MKYNEIQMTYYGIHLNTMKVVRSSIYIYMFCLFLLFASCLVCCKVFRVGLLGLGILGVGSRDWWSTWRRSMASRGPSTRMRSCSHAPMDVSLRQRWPWPWRPSGSAWWSDWSAAAARAWAGMRAGWSRTPWLPAAACGPVQKQYALAWARMLWNTHIHAV